MRLLFTMSRIKKGSTATKFNALLISAQLRMSSFSVIHVISHLKQHCNYSIVYSIPEKLLFRHQNLSDTGLHVIYSRPISRTIASKLNETRKVTELFKP